MSNKEAPSLTKSCNKLALPDITRPTRQVKPIIAPFRFLIALMRCNVRLIPALLSMAKSPTCKTKVLVSRKHDLVCFTTFSKKYQLISKKIKMTLSTITISIRKYQMISCKYRLLGLLSYNVKSFKKNPKVYQQILYLYQLPYKTI